MATSPSLTQTDNRESGWLLGDGQRDLVSIVVPTFNRATLVIELLDCLNLQTWKPLQIVVVDDGSTDDTAEHIERWKQSHQGKDLLYLWKTNAGVSSARNTGLRHCRGEFIYFIDSDDLIFPDAIESMVEQIRTSGCPFCVATIRTAGRDGVAIDSAGKLIPSISKDRVFRNNWPTHGALHCRRAIREAGPYNENLGLGEDIEMHWRISSVSSRPAVLLRVIGLRRIHDQGHLWYGSSKEQEYIPILNAMSAYVQWALERGFHSEGVSQELLRQIPILAVNFGKRSDWNSKERALELLANSSKHYPLLSSLIGALLSPRFPILFTFFDTVLKLGKKIMSFRA
jgi:glycosyltransferase involved in cell wall biosynthesis